MIADDVEHILLAENISWNLTQNFHLYNYLSFTISQLSTRIQIVIVGSMSMLEKISPDDGVKGRIQNGKCMNVVYPKYVYIYLWRSKFNLRDPTLNT